MDIKSSVVQPPFPMLIERNYDTWFIKMRKSMHAQDLWEFVMIGYPKLSDQAVELDLSNDEHVLLKENRKKDKNLLALLSIV